MSHLEGTYVGLNGPEGGNTGDSTTVDIKPKAVELGRVMVLCDDAGGVFLDNPGALKAKRNTNGINISISVVRQERRATSRRFQSSSEICVVHVLGIVGVGVGVGTCFLKLFFQEI